MTPRKLPPLNTLRAFEASARHQSFTLAAQELSVTQGAVSHQVKALEAELGLKLFERSANQLRLTETGRRYVDVIKNAFDEIERGTQSLYRPHGKKALVISTSPNFASKWLVPRLGSFSAIRPQLELRMELTPQQVNFQEEDVSLAIRYGDGPWPGLHCTRLGTEFLAPVCAPTCEKITAPEEMTRHVLLHSHDHRAWGEWFDANTLPRTLAKKGIVFNQESAAVDAAVSGQGIALARSTLIVQDLIQKRLTVAFPQTTPIPQSYWLVYPDAVDVTADVIAFRDWLLEAFEADRQFWKLLERAAA